MTTTEASSEPVWAVVELMGHVKVAGRLSEEEKFGSKLGRLDIPEPDGPGFVTQFFGGGSVYRITVVTEDVARHVARGNRPEPVSPWDFPNRLPAAGPVSPVILDDDPDDDRGYGFDNCGGRED